MEKYNFKYKLIITINIVFFKIKCFLVLKNIFCIILKADNILELNIKKIKINSYSFIIIIYLFKYYYYTTFEFKDFIYICV